MTIETTFEMASLPLFEVFSMAGYWFMVSSIHELKTHANHMVTSLYVVQTIRKHNIKKSTQFV